MVCSYPLGSLDLSSFISPMRDGWVPWVLHHGSSQDLFIFCAWSAAFFHCHLLRAVMLSTSPKNSLILITMKPWQLSLFSSYRLIYLLSKGPGLNSPSNEYTCGPPHAITNLGSSCCIHVFQIIAFWSMRRWCEAKVPLAPWEVQAVNGELLGTMPGLVRTTRKSKMVFLFLAYL